jgi:hypothetical protein
MMLGIAMAMLKGITPLSGFVRQWSEVTGKIQNTPVVIVMDVDKA